MTDAQLAAGRPFNSTIVAASPTFTPASAYRLVGKRIPRIDIPNIVTGSTTYIQNVCVTGIFAELGLDPPEAVMTDNAMVYRRSRRFRQLLDNAGIRHIRTPICTPRRKARIVAEHAAVRRVSRRREQVQRQAGGAAGHGSAVVRVEYEAVRAHPKRFIVAPSDERVFPQFEEVVSRRARYWVVEKSGQAAQIAGVLDAERTSPVSRHAP